MKLYEYGSSIQKHNVYTFQELLRTELLMFPEQTALVPEFSLSQQNEDELFRSPSARNTLI